MAAVDGASSWSDAIAAWSWYGPTRRIRIARSSERLPLVDPRPVPARPILVLEQDELAGGSGPRLPARVVEEHQRQEPEHLRLVRHQCAEHPDEADRLGRQLAPDEPVAGGRAVALVEHEIEHAQDAIEPFRQGVVVRDSIGDPRVADLPLRPDEPLGERRLRDEEGAGDLGGREAAEGAQRQRHPGVHRAVPDGST